MPRLTHLCVGALLMLLCVDLISLAMCFCFIFSVKIQKKEYRCTPTLLTLNLIL